MRRPLSQAAELLLLAIDPERGGLLPCDRGRFGRALAVAAGGAPGRLAGWRARRRALGELIELGLARRGRRGPVLADRSAPGVQFRPLREALLNDTLESERDTTLLLLLAYAGLLHDRLGRADRRVAYRRLRGEIPHSGAVAALGLGAADFDFLPEEAYRFDNSGSSTGGA